MKCPICGAEVVSTALTCGKHISFEYDAKGNLVAYSDIIETTPGRWVSIRREVWKELEK